MANRDRRFLLTQEEVNYVWWLLSYRLSTEETLPEHEIRLSNSIMKAMLDEKNRQLRSGGGSREDIKMHKALKAAKKKNPPAKVAWDPDDLPADMDFLDLTSFEL